MGATGSPSAAIPSAPGHYDSKSCIRTEGFDVDKLDLWYKAFKLSFRTKRFRSFMVSKRSNSESGQTPKPRDNTSISVAVN